MSWQTKIRLIATLASQCLNIHATCSCSLSVQSQQPISELVVPGTALCPALPAPAHLELASALGLNERGSCGHVLTHLPQRAEGSRPSERHCDFSKLKHSCRCAFPAHQGPAQGCSRHFSKLEAIQETGQCIIKGDPWPKLTWV